jgi:hypothetical protein
MSVSITAAAQEVAAVRKLLAPLPVYALEQLRSRFLNAVTTTHDPVAAALRTVQMAFETEIGVALAKVVSVLDSDKEVVVAVARRYLEIDADLRAYSFLIDPAVDALDETGVLPGSYVDLVRGYLESPYPRYRVSAIAALLVLAASFLNPDLT